MEINKKFLKDGRAVHFKESLASGNLVQLIMEDEEPGEESLFGDIFLVDEIFDAAPTAAYDKAILSLRQTVESLRAELIALNKTKAEMKSAGVAIDGFSVLERFAKFAVSDKIWWLKNGSDLPTEKPRLLNKSDSQYAYLTLKNGKISAEWRISYDDHGQICFSEQEANEVARASIVSAMENPGDGGWRHERIIEAAKLYAVPLSPEFISFLAEFKKKAAEARLEKARAELALAEKAWEACAGA